MVACPSQLTESDRNECVALIVKGGAVNPASVERWLPSSIMAAVKRSGTEIIGVGVIKPARRRYAQTVATRSGAELHPDMHELGYVVVKEEHQGQGISRAVVQALLAEHDAPLFATTSDVR